MPHDTQHLTDAELLALRKKPGAREGHEHDELSAVVGVTDDGRRVVRRVTRQPKTRLATKRTERLLRRLRRGHKLRNDGSHTGPKRGAAQRRR